MEFGLIAIALGVGYVLHSIFRPRRAPLDLALEHLENGSPVRAECVAEQAFRAANRRPKSLAAGEAGVDFALILIAVGDISRARKILDEAVSVLGTHGVDLGRAQDLQATLTHSPEAPASEDGEWQMVPSDAPVAASTDSQIADRCSTGGCGSFTPGVVEPEASRAFAELLAGGRAAGLIGAAEIRREGDRLTPRVTFTGDLTGEEEKVVERAVKGAMGVLFGV